MKENLLWMKVAWTPMQNSHMLNTTPKTLLQPKKAFKNAYYF